MVKDKTKSRRILELIVLVTIVACVALVLVELATNLRAELWSARSTPALTTAVRRSTHPKSMRSLLRRFPSAAMALALADFAVYRLEVRGGRLVAAFGRALNFSASHFQDLSGEQGPYNPISKKLLRATCVQKRASGGEKWASR
jgi:hypothetical protein